MARIKITNTGKDQEEIAWFDDAMRWIDEGAFDEYGARLHALANSAIMRLVDAGYPVNLDTSLVDPTKLAKKRPQGFNRGNVKVGGTYVLVTSRNQWWSGCTIEVTKCNPAKVVGIVVDQVNTSRTNKIGRSINGPYDLIDHEV